VRVGSTGNALKAANVVRLPIGDTFDKIFDRTGPFLGLLAGGVRLIREDDNDGGALSRLLRVKELEARAIVRVAKVDWAGVDGGEIAESRLLRRE
jgi:hypothetical protein